MQTEISSSSTPKSFGFSINPKKKSIEKKKNEEEEEKDFVFSFGENGIVSSKKKPDEKPLSIPLISQTLKYSSKPSESSTSESTEPEIQQSIEQSINEDQELEKMAVEEILKESNDQKPLLVRNRMPGIESIENEDERFKYDVENRPDESVLEDYERIPIDKYGEALLRGMGWDPEKPIGLRCKEIIKPIEYIPRPGRLGLGAVVKEKPKSESDSGNRKKRIIKPGEKREEIEDPYSKIMVLPSDGSGKVRHYRTLDEKLVPLRVEIQKKEREKKERELRETREREREEERNRRHKERDERKRDRRNHHDRDYDNDSDERHKRKRKHHS